MRLPWFSRSRRIRHKQLIRVPYLGRDADLDALREHLQAARGGEGQYVVVEGAPGYGKSELLKTFTILDSRAPDVLFIRLHAGDWLTPSAFYMHLFRAVHEHSSRVLQTVYVDVKRLRKMLGVQWDETEFAQFLVSADWSQINQTVVAGARRGRGYEAPLRQLLSIVREHPWALAAAACLDMQAREGRPQESWPQRWQTLLATMRQRQSTPAPLVLIIDQLDSNIDTDFEQQSWRQHWLTFADATQASRLPVMLVWAGTIQGVQPVHQALEDLLPLTAYPLGPLDESDAELLLSRLQKSLPRQHHATWGQFCAAHPELRYSPGTLLLAAAWVAAGDASAAPRLSAPFPATTADVVQELVRRITRQFPEHEALLQQVLEVCAFQPATKVMTVDYVMLLCDLDALGLDPVSGRTGIETLLGACVQVGLLQYDAYEATYTTGHGAIQEALQYLIYPDAFERREVARQHQLAAAILSYLRIGQKDLLHELASVLDAEAFDAVEVPLASLVRRSFRRLLTQSTKDERQDMATALGSFSTSLAAELLAMMLQDSEGQVRSRAVQALADLDGLDTQAALLIACRDSNSDVRWIAAQALSTIQGSATVDALITMLNDDDKEVGRIAAQGLGAQGDIRAVPHLIAAMRDNYPLLRESAALALGKLADRRALPALQALLQDTHPQVRRSAERALARLTSLPS